MSADPADLHVLVVEDEYIIAMELAMLMEDEGVAVIGPAATLAEAQELCRSSPRIDGALLDVKLQGEAVFPLADFLQAEAVPFLFSTGCGAQEIPERFVDVPVYEKPFGSAAILQAFMKDLRQARRAAAAQA